MSVMNRMMNFLGLQDEEEIIEREQVIEPNDDLEMNYGEQRKKNKANVVSIHSQKKSQLVLTEPRSYEEAQEIADHLRSRRPVIVNLQRVRTDQAMRIIDFLSGTVYALSGNIAKVGRDIFLCTPDSVEIQGAITEILTEEADHKKTR